MARGRRKGNTDTLDAKIEQQKAVLEKAKAKYEAEKEIKKADKNGKMRKAGFLGASKWFRENYKDAYEEITKNKKTNKK